MPVADSISIVQGSTIVTGYLTAFSAARGDVLLVRGRAVTILEVETASTMRLVVPWTDASVADATEWTIHPGPYWSSQQSVNERITDLITKYEAGFPFRPGASGTLAERPAYNNQPRGFTFLRTDVVPFRLSGKRSDASGDWSDEFTLQGVKGDPGAPPELRVDLSTFVLQYRIQGASAWTDLVDLDTLIGTYRTDAQASAAAAATSATNAAGSASAAAGSASAASASANAAAGSATSASGSASTATTKAGEATTGATTATTKAAEASTSASTAQKWATQTNQEVEVGQGYGARKYANDAASSATAAAGSATAASGSATTASTKAGEASASATAAANSATTATTKAGEASTSATNAATSATSAATSASTATTKLAEFKGLYYGPLSADPTTRPDGSASQDGDFYYNTTSHALRLRSGGLWTAAVLSAGDALARTNNLSDLPDKPTARTNLSVYSKAETDTALAGKAPLNHQHSASDVTSGVLDPARLPVLPSSVQIVSAGGVADLTGPQQAEIGDGSVVTTTDGRRWVYSGGGSKTAEASYIELADLTPEWDVIANKPMTFPPSVHGHAIADVTGLPAALDAKLDDSQATAFGLSLLDDANAAAARATLGLTSGASDLVLGALNGGPLAGSRNRAINGDFRVNQRGYTSGASLAAGAYGHDRWKATAGGSIYTFTSNGSGGNIVTVTGGTLVQVIEGALVEGGSFVLSWAGTGVMRVGINGAAPSGAYLPSPILVTGVTAGQNVTLEGGGGSLTNVQFEPGTVATPFERRPLPAEEGLCQRYFRLFPVAADFQAPGAGQPGACAVPFSPPMRATPTMATVTTYASNVASVSAPYGDGGGLLVQVVPVGTGRAYHYAKHSASAEL